MVDLAGLRVCLLAGTLQQGGAERQLFYAVHALRASGAEVDVLSLTQGEAWEKPFRDAGFPVTWVGRSNLRAVRLGTIVGRLRRHPADIVQSQHFFANAYAAGAARAVGARGIGAVRSNGLSELAHGRLQGPLNMRSPRLIAVNSVAAIEAITEAGYPADKFHLLPNTVDTEQFEPVGPKAGALRMLSVGRLTRAKRFDRLLRALAEVHEASGGEARGLIVGGRREDDVYADLHRQAGALGLLPDGVTFGGAIADLAPVYAGADVFVLTSDYEGTPNVVLEAMACGLPVVCTRVGDVPEIVRDGDTGFLVDPDDERGLTDALLRLNADEELRAEMGARARRWIVENHSPAQLPSLLSELYARALA